eukprot:snap_masked-scaffold_2-processed-gene-1.36-mRNA-1 protein AED:1.00 eAED:1.00 QI:0/-1/0/0/-1/1/1/0/774
MDSAEIKETIDKLRKTHEDPLINQLINSDIPINELVNNAIPNETYISNISSILKQLDKVEQEIDTDLARNFNQLQSNQNSETEINSLKSSMNKLEAEFSKIKTMTEESKEVVSDICEGIEELNIAKNNLTFSISSIKKFHMLLTAHDQLVFMISKSQYTEISKLFVAITELLEYFKNNNMLKISKIANINESIEKKKETLKNSIFSDFKVFCNIGNSDLNGNISQPVMRVKTPEVLESAALVINSFGKIYVDELKIIVIKCFTLSYVNLFFVTENFSNSHLDEIKRHFNWYFMKTKDIEKNYLSLFPSTWKMKETFSEEFSKLFSSYLRKCLNNLTESKSLDVGSLMRSFKATLDFEKAIGIVNNASSAVYEPFLSVYIDKEISTIKEQLQNAQKEDETKDKIFKSCSTLFLSIKSSLLRCSKFSNETSLYNLYKNFKSVLHSYADYLNSKLPSGSQKKEEKQQNFSWKLGITAEKKAILSERKEENLEVCGIVLNTAFYCAETLKQLEELIQNMIAETFKDSITFEVEQNVFYSKVNLSLKEIENNFSLKCKEFLSEGFDVDWSKFSSVGDSSKFISHLEKYLSKNFTNLKEILSENNFISLKNKITLSIVQNFEIWLNDTKFTEGSKFVNVFGAQQLLLDTQGLRSFLSRDLNPKIKTIVNLNLQNIENLLKIVGMPKETNEDLLIENFKTLINEQSRNLDNFELILKLRGLKKGKTLSNLLLKAQGSGIKSDVSVREQKIVQEQEENPANLPQTKLKSLFKSKRLSFNFKD